MAGARWNLADREFLLYTSRDTENLKKQRKQVDMSVAMEFSTREKAKENQISKPILILEGVYISFLQVFES